MKRTLSTLAILLFCSFCLSGQAEDSDPAAEKRADLRIPELDRSWLEPNIRARLPAEVAPTERNPFGLMVPPAPEETEVRVVEQSEEEKLRDIINQMPVKGISSLPGVPDSYRVMLGSLMLEKGDRLPRMLYNQVEAVRVKDITDRKVEFVFEEAPGVDRPPREFAKGFESGLSTRHDDGSPRVSEIASGEVFLAVRRMQKEMQKGEVEVVDWRAAQVIAAMYETEAMRAAYLGVPRRFVTEKWPRSFFQIPPVSPPGGVGNGLGKNESGASP